uniref:Uncharacterized protein C9orf43 homolog n=1 Tax=Castor canadensis TaxID=51338 RepID=A0A8B7U9A9_CASCN|nr:uncharacterized protein C9orf43 homolog [Castor canadensis]
MDLPEESQWDETTCNLAICQHPQCWATVRRIERGHPRILGSLGKTPLDVQDKLPVLTVANFSNSYLQAKRLTQQHLSGFTFTKARSLLCRGSKLDFKFQRRPQRSFPDKSVMEHTDRFPKLSVLNLNETQLPCSEDVRNMVVIWIPEKTEKNVWEEVMVILVSSSAEKTPTFWHGKKRRKKLKGESKPPLCLPGRQYTDTRLETPGVVVPPPSPVHFFEQSSSESVPVWAHADSLPQDLLKDLLPDGGNNVPCAEMKLQLSVMKRNLPLEKNRPDSEISSKMFLTIQRLTLQTPSLRYPEGVKKLHYNLKRDGSRKQQQWQQQRQQQQQQQQLRKMKTTAKKQEARKKSKSDPESQKSSCKHSLAIIYNPVYAKETCQSTLSVSESDVKLVEMEAISKQGVITQSVMDDFDNYLALLSSLESTDKSETEFSYNEASLPEDATLGASAAVHKKALKNFSESMAKIGWNPELKLLRILQATADEEEENHPSGAQSVESLEL